MVTEILKKSAVKVKSGIETKEVAFLTSQVLNDVKAETSVEAQGQAIRWRPGDVRTTSASALSDEEYPRFGMITPGSPALHGTGTRAGFLFDGN